MIVYDLDIVGTSIFPSKAKPPPFGDTNTVLTLPVRFQGLKMIARRHCQVPQSSRPVEVEQFATRRSFERFESRDGQVVEQILGLLVFEGLDHNYSVLRMASYVKRAESLDWLDRAVRVGDERTDWFQMDPLLTNIRKEPRFRQIIDGIRYRREQQARSKP